MDLHPHRVVRYTYHMIFDFFTFHTDLWDLEAYSSTQKKFEHKNNCSYIQIIQAYKNNSSHRRVMLNIIKII